MTNENKRTTTTQDPDRRDQALACLPTPVYRHMVFGVCVGVFWNDVPGFLGSISVCCSLSGTLWAGGISGRPPSCLRRDPLGECPHLLPQMRMPAGCETMDYGYERRRLPLRALSYRLEHWNVAVFRYIGLNTNRRLSGNSNQTSERRLAKGRTSVPTLSERHDSEWIMITGARI